VISFDDLACNLGWGALQYNSALDGNQVISFDDLACNLGWGALQYNCGRDLCSYDSNGAVVPASTSAMRVLAVLTAAWALGGTDNCDVLAGAHKPSCVHQCGRVRYTRQWLAREAFGACGGSQRVQVTKALSELTNPEMGYLDEHDRGVGPVLTLATPEDLVADAHQARGIAAFDPVLTESMLAGHMQRIPIGLIRDLRGSALRPWLYILLRARSSLTRKPGQFVEVAATGRRASADMSFLGMRKMRPGRVAASLQRSADAGNRVQTEWRLDVVARRQGGVKMRLVRLEARSPMKNLRRAA
jgi:hypothetical protein